MLCLHKNCTGVREKGSASGIYTTNVVMTRGRKNKGKATGGGDEEEDKSLRLQLELMGEVIIDLKREVINLKKCVNNLQREVREFTKGEIDKRTDQDTSNEETNNSNVPISTVYRSEQAVENKGEEEEKDNRNNEDRLVMEGMCVRKGKEQQEKEKRKSEYSAARARKKVQDEGAIIGDVVDERIVEVNEYERENIRDEGSVSKILVLGDSLIKYSGNMCKEMGATVHCFPGIRVDELKRKVESMEVSADIIVVHAGTNNVREGVWADEVMGEMMDLVDVLKRNNTKAKIIVSGVIKKRGVDMRTINSVNDELSWLCERRECLMVDGNCWIEESDIARDGVHLNRRGAYKLGGLLCRAISFVQGN